MPDCATARDVDHLSFLNTVHGFAWHLLSTLRSAICYAFVHVFTLLGDTRLIVVFGYDAFIQLSTL